MDYSLHLLVSQILHPLVFTAFTEESPGAWTTLDEAAAAFLLSQFGERRKTDGAFDAIFVFSKPKQFGYLREGLERFVQHIFVTKHNYLRVVQASPALYVSAPGAEIAHHVFHVAGGAGIFVSHEVDGLVNTEAKMVGGGKYDVQWISDDVDSTRGDRHILQGMLLVGAKLVM